MEPLTITLGRVEKRFTQRPVFKPVSFESSSSEIIAITGANGAGKSTLLKIIAGVLAPTKGSCEWTVERKKLDPDAIRIRMGYAAPYLELYGELTAVEHMQFVAEMKGIPLSNARDLLEKFGLDPAITQSDRRLRAYSSGMKQRVRSAMAFACSPSVLFLDEPTSNLDEVGTFALLAQATEAAQNGAIVFIATNDERERSLAHREIHLESA
ncbi:MAG TPA: ABC transporter ATP-binding protein [Candidatus Kapabacteria bacterium]